MPQPPRPGRPSPLKLFLVLNALASLAAFGSENPGTRATVAPLFAAAALACVGCLERQRLNRQRLQIQPTLHPEARHAREASPVRHGWKPARPGPRHEPTMKPENGRLLCRR